MKVLLLLDMQNKAFVCVFNLNFILKYSQYRESEKEHEAALALF